MRALYTSVLFLATAAMLGQGENNAYFALSSFRTYSSQDKPTVALSAFNARSLDFRVYRINDPVEFFKKLDDPHQFGLNSPQPPRDRTLLERVHLWKRGLRANIRRALRGQFSESPSAHFQNLFGNKSAVTAVTPGIKATQYAETPVLNSQQLVLSFPHPVTTGRWDREDVEIPVREKGIYLVEAVQKDLRAYTLLMVSDLALITKAANGKVVNFVVDRGTGQPVAGAKLDAWTKRNEFHAESNGDGIVEWKDLIHSDSAEGSGGDLMVLARRGRDVAVNTLSTDSFAGDRDQWTGYIYTDRPVYRPGHIVHFKGILRLRTPDGYEVPAGRKVSVEIQDADQKPVYQKTLTASANGSVQDDITLAGGASLGYYFIQMKAGQGYMAGNFEVQEYKKPEYEVRVSPSKPRVLQGETVQATIDARYFFGEPVAGAKLTYSIYREPYWFPLWYDPDDDTPQYEPNADNNSGGDQLSNQDAMLNADGKFTVSVPTSLSERKQDFLYRVEARVTDGANRETSGTGWIVATYGSFVINVSPEQYLYMPGSQARLKVEARNYDNQPVKTRVHVELVRTTYRKRETIVASTDADVNTDSTGNVSLAIPNEGGSYQVRATARTPEGRDVQSTSYLWVEGGTWGADGSRQQNVQIITDKKTYSAGETAKLMIVAGQPGTPVMISVEGRDIRQHTLIRANSSTVPFEVPVTAKDEPGITVNAMFLRNGAVYQGSKYVRVPPAEHQLNVKLSTDKAQYKPGEAAAYNIEVTGTDGKPVPRAEFSLGVVDEAIYGVRKDTTQNILSFFFGRDYNRVQTMQSLEYYFNGEAGKRRMQLAQLRPRSRLAQLKPQQLVQPKVRKAFPDTALWLANVTTDADGRAHAKVEYPDSLTTWRATARGITPDTKVGAATLKTIVRKNLILRLAVPRFFVQGDEVTISALVHNYLETTKSAKVSLDMTGLDVIDGVAKDVEIPSRGEVKVSWKVHAQRVRNVTITGKALTNEESDALEVQIPVDIPGVKLGQAKGGSLNAGAAASFDITYPDNIEPGSRSLSIRLSPSVAGSMFGALDFLTSFPYGCVEQTMSSFLPNIVVKDAVRSLGLKADLDEASLREKIRTGLERLYSFQHEDGGWGWWQTDDSHPFMTAYVVAGLVQARTAGVNINEEALRKGANWLKKNLQEDPRLIADLRAYMVYALALAGEANASLTAEIYGKQSSLSPYGMAMLGLTLELVKDNRASEIATALEKAAQQNQEEAWWPATRDPMLDFTEDVTPEATAYVTKFLSHQRKDSPLLPKAALWLMNHRNEGYWWSSTKQTAMVIYGLTDYLKVTNELMPNLTATVWVNDKAVLTRKLDQATTLNAPELVLDESKLQAGVNHIRVTTSSGQGRLYYAIRGDYSSTDPRLQKTGTTSLNLLRDYFRLNPIKTGTGDNERFVYDTVPLQGPVNTGDVIAVRLTVTGTDWRYLLVEDPIPAGTEFIERDNLYELRERPPWWGYFFTRRELHDDRMAIFQTYFSKGQQEYFYLLKVVNPGAFQVSPARVEPMYQKDVIATTESRRLIVEEAK